MQTEDSDSISPGPTAALPAIGALRVITLAEPDEQARRRAPRRRTYAAVLVERRRGERRRAKPGIDGLLRMVLADVWK